MDYSNFSREQFEEIGIFELRHIAREMGVRSPTNKRKGDLINEIIEACSKGIKPPPDDKPRRGRPPKAIFKNRTKEDTFKSKEPDIVYQPKLEITREEKVACDEAVNPQELETRSGVLEIMPDGYGFLRAKNYESGAGDSYISALKIRKSGLKKGDFVVAKVRQSSDNRPAGVLIIEEVNGRKPNAAYNRPNFDNLTPIYPDEMYRLEIPSVHNDYAIRCIDLVAPIGKGQRAMIVSPPKAGKTTLLKLIAKSISRNYPKSHLMVLLVDERPEEVTDMQRSIDGEVIYSTFDEMPEHHTKASELVLERAKRLVEHGEDVVILMDSLTRLARAYNMVIAPTGRTLSGGIDPGALHNPKRFFGAARNIENGGSLTIIATALIDTGSRMDDVIYEEFKGTGNMEIHLDRKLSEKRIFPALDLNRSGTRREELLLSSDELQGIWSIRKMLSNGENQEAAENLINMLIKTKNNKEFIEQLNIQLMRIQKSGYTLR
ncbi:MAG: transcription termination factor Rho [Christensenellales bacterium]|jgi:transcription termination factor Rho